MHAIGQAAADYPLGAGLGVAGPAGPTAGGSPLDGNLNAESEFSFLTVEAGIPALIAVVGFSFLLLGLGFARCRREPDPQARILLAAVISPLAGIVVDYYAGPLSVTVPAGPYLWFAGGVIAYWLVALPARRAQGEAVAASGTPGDSQRRGHREP